MKKHQIFIATLVLSLMATLQSLQAQTVTNSDKSTYSNSTYVNPAYAPMRSFEFVSSMDYAGIDVLNPNASINYEVYTKTDGSSQWTMVERVTGLTNQTDAYVYYNGGYDALIKQPESYQMKVVVYATDAADFSLVFRQ